MVALYVSALSAALSGAFLIAAIVAAWHQFRPRPKLAAAETWLLEEGIDRALVDVLRPVLLQLWSAAWRIGGEAADHAGGTATRFEPQLFLMQWGQQWLNQVVRTRLAELARILAEGPEDLPGLAREVRAYLTSEANAERIAATEVTRAINLAAQEAYRNAGIWEVRWVTEGPDPCPQCVANREDGPRQIGVPFSSGAVAPPQHPRCRCALMPA